MTSKKILIIYLGRVQSVRKVRILRFCLDSQRIKLLYQNCLLERSYESIPLMMISTLNDWTIVVVSLLLLVSHVSDSNTMKL
jgi:hypothetical protein